MLTDEYQELYEAAPVGLWRTSIEDGRFLHANKTTISILGYNSFEELSQLLTTDLYDHSLRADLISELQKVQEISGFEVNIKRKDGKNIWISLSAKIYPDKGYMEGTIQDISDKKSQEAMIVPHLEKLSLLKQHIQSKLNECHCISLRTF